MALAGDQGCQSGQEIEAASQLPLGQRCDPDWGNVESFITRLVGTIELDVGA